MMDNNGLGVITEQGDLGLGFEPLTPEEIKTLNEANNKEESEEDSKKTKR